jgi:serpin B
MGCTAEKLLVAGCLIASTSVCGCFGPLAGIAPDAGRDDTGTVEVPGDDTGSVAEPGDDAGETIDASLDSGGAVETGVDAEAGPTPSGCASAGVEDLVTADTAFAVAFFPPAIAQAGAGSTNAIFSPYSVSDAMMMVDVGAVGETASQIETVLHLPSSGTAEAPAYEGLACGTQADGASNGNALDVANALWGQQGVTFETAFLNVLAQGYSAPLQTVDFASDATAATTTINHWVSQATQGNITSLLGPNDVDADTRLVLVNAVYFKGTWATGFDPTMTASQPFTLADGSKAMVTTMTGTILTSVAYSSTLTVVELPYKGNALAMDILMPKGPLSTFESTLTPAALSAALPSREAAQWYIVYLPRFSFTTNVELASVLEGMGMTDAFDGNTANLSGMDGAMDLSIGAVVQQARVDVDEQGTVAAAGTGVSVCSNCLAISTPPSVEINQPFVFLIRDTRSGAIVFMGQVVNPGQ